MKCLVFSDSHGSAHFMRRALDLHPDAEVVFFLGDGLSEAQTLAASYKDKFWIFVRGNCDSCAELYLTDVKKVESIRLSGHSITLTHGDLYGAKYGNGALISLAEQTGADILLYGHTHTPKCDYFGDREPSLYLFNPGSIARGDSYGVLILGDVPFFSHGSFV